MARTPTVAKDQHIHSRCGNCYRGRRPHSAKPAPHPHPTNRIDSGIRKERKISPVKAKHLIKALETLPIIFGDSNIPPETPRDASLTLLDLPAELRIMIYEYLFSNLLIHINRRKGPASSSRVHFTSSACIKQSSKSPLLCRNPIFDIIDKKRCNHLEPAKRDQNRMAFFLTCRLIFQETRLMIYSQPVLHIGHEDFRPFVDMLNPDQRGAIRRLTLTSPFMSGRRIDGNVGDALRCAREMLPNLRRVGFQGPMSNGMMATNTLVLFAPRWRMWNVSQALLEFRTRSNVESLVLETWTLYRTRDVWTMYVFKAKQEKMQWQKDPENFTKEMDKGELVVSKRRKLDIWKWREYWPY
ncbi:hypothetical protein K432DRAFT_390122 [Lepidopterella palustris CBS 459.81]|uniref:DUF7730 domain-containing protein n=1 Tax=Lepidopterella palustris CBS 459.81 TaxID=1314670 RepID=A0A8E2JIJ1_9PEZI|nr:hypothetical protein K432DRAFT_390122 [Lepidopterella palustris CBS 459.81]